MVGDINGPGHVRVRRDVIRALRARAHVAVVDVADLEDTEDSDEIVEAAAEHGIHAIIRGQVTRRGRRWTARLEAFQGSDGESVVRGEFHGRNAATLGRAVGAGLWDSFGEAITAASAPPPSPSTHELGPVHVGTGGSDDDEGDDDDDDHVDDHVDLPVAIDVGIGGRGFSRELRYTDDHFGLLRGYRLDFGPALGPHAALVPRRAFH